MLKSTLVIVALIILGKLSGFFKDVLLTYFYNIGLETDALFLTTYIASLLYIALYSSISIVIIPKCLDTLKNKSPIKELYSLYVAYIVLSIILTIATIVYSKNIVSLFNSNNNTEIIDLSSNYLQLMALTFPLSTIIGILNSLQTVKNKLTLVYLTPVVNNFLFCIALFMFHEMKDFYYVLIAGLFSWCLLLFINISFEVISLRKVFKRLSKIRISKRSFFVLGLASLFVFIEQVNSFIPIYFISMSEEGSITLYTLASKLNFLILSVSLLVITTHLLPKLAVCSNSKENEKLLLDIFKMLSLLSFPIVFICYVQSYSIVSLLFSRGSFTVEDTNGLSSMFSLLVLMLPFFIFKDILNRSYFTQKRTKHCLLITVFATLINLIQSYFFYQIAGTEGVVISLVCTTYIQVMMLLIFSSKTFKYDLLCKVINIALLRAIIALVPIFLLYFYSFSLITYTILYLVIYLALLYLTGEVIIINIIKKYKHKVLKNV